MIIESVLSLKKRKYKNKARRRWGRNKAA